MAISFNTQSPRSHGRYRPLSEINVTPLVDVMLVLLIIFMVTAPLLTSGVTVNLPKANAQPVNQDATPITISINAEGAIYLGDAEVPLQGLVPKLRAIANNNPNRRIFVRGDRSIPYGQIMQVMATISQGGFTKVALLAEDVPSLAPSGTASTKKGG